MFIEILKSYSRKIDHKAFIHIIEKKTLILKIEIENVFLYYVLIILTCYKVSAILISF